MQNMPMLELSAAVLCLLTYVKLSPLLRNIGARAQQSFDSDGQLVWSTRKGEVFEDIETFFVRAESVTFRHKQGTSRVAISELSEGTRTQLIRRYQENHSLAILPRENDVREVRTFEVEAA